MILMIHGWAAPGCKRIVYDSGYLDALHRPNVDVCRDEIQSIAENGLVTTASKISAKPFASYGIKS